jgi:hypothetical protein
MKKTKKAPDGFEFDDSEWNNENDSTENAASVKSPVEYPSDTPDMIPDTNAEIKALRKSMAEGMDKEKLDKSKAVNPNFWFAVYFQDEEQKNEFLKNTGLQDKTKGQFVNGLDLAKAVNIPLTKKSFEIPKKIRSFTI